MKQAATLQEAMTDALRTDPSGRHPGRRIVLEIEAEIDWTEPEKEGAA